jgi:hypothetical protein
MQRAVAGFLVQHPTYWGKCAVDQRRESIAVDESRIKLRRERIALEGRAERRSEVQGAVSREGAAADVSWQAVARTTEGAVVHVHAHVHVRSSLPPGADCHPPLLEWRTEGLRLSKLSSWASSFLFHPSGRGSVRTKSGVANAANSTPPSSARSLLRTDVGRTSSSGGFSIVACTRQSE